MPTFPLSGVQRIENAGANTANSSATTVTAAAGTHTKGNYAQLIASSGFPSQAMLIVLTNGQAGVDYLVDIAIGGAGSEQIIIANLPFSQAPLNVDCCYYFPFGIPAGTRIAARAQASGSSASLRISILLFGGGFAQPEGFTGAETMGADTSDSGGTSIDPGGSANTKGSYVQLSAACAYELRGLVIGIGHQQNIARTTGRWLVDVAIGGAGSEQVIVPNLTLFCTGASDMILPFTFGFIPICIPAGSCVAVRAQCDITDATDRLFDIILIGVY